MEGTFIKKEHHLIVHDTTIYEQKDAETAMVIGYVIKGFEDDQPLSLQQAIDFGIGEFMVAHGFWSLEE